MALAALDDTREAYPEIFLLYNEQDRDGARQVGRLLEAEGFRTFYFDRDVPIGETVEKDSAALRSARIVIVILGPSGWGPTQRRMAHEAFDLQKSMFQVRTTGKIPRSAAQEADKLFGKARWLDLSTMDAANLQPLLASLKDAGTRSSDIQEILEILIDGSDVERAKLLDQVINHGIPDPAALAERLRRAIRDEFSPASPSNPSSSRRDPGRVESARSWMLSALIDIDPESRASEELLRAHLDPAYEPVASIRYWVLAGLIRRQCAFQDILVTATGDPDLEISGLALIVLNPTDQSMLHMFAQRLTASVSDARPVLRIMRIVPVPQLIETATRSLANTEAAYDVLYALAHPELASQVSRALAAYPGHAETFQIIIATAEKSSPRARRTFGWLLSLLDPAVIEPLVRRMGRDPQTAKLMRELESLATPGVSEAEADEVFIAGYSSDTIDVDNDDIGISHDVQILASVMLARDVRPPLAIGLFGAWGSGKTFFMQSIDRAIKRLAGRAKREESERFCGEVVQIHFNAWHYSDSNLWASLVSNILDKLAGHVKREKSDGDKEVILQTELASAKKDLALAEQERKEAADQLAQIEQSLQESRLERQRKEIRLRDLRAADLITLLNDNDLLKGELNDALKAVGAPEVIESIDALNQVVTESYTVAGRAAALGANLLKGGSLIAVLIGIVLCFGVPATLYWLIEKCISPNMATLSALSAEAVIVVGTVTKLVSAAASKARSGLNTLVAAKAKVDKALADKRAQPSPEENELAKEVEAARASEDAAAKRLAAATAHAIELESRMMILRQNQSLGYFLTQRTASDDYRRHLGLLSTIREDFEGLVVRLQNKEKNSEFEAIDRIVLYIDDLDRCPPKMVVEVLQAVHLLLAYELFVVVVSVDPRWLVKSLKARLSHLEEIGDEADSELGGWSATPQLYLEKIFQIPFSVRPMSGAAFGRLIGRLLAPSAAPDHTVADEITSAAPASRGGSDTKPAMPSLLTEDGLRLVLEDGTPLAMEDGAQPELDLEQLGEAIAITPGESQFAAELHSFIATPRAAKRFANIYRLLKATVPRRDLALHEGAEGEPGDFQIPMLLLALLVGYPAEAPQIFSHFLTQAASLPNRFWGGDIGRPGLDALLAQARQICDRPSFPQSGERLAFWLPRVARYSFATADLFKGDKEG